MNNNKSYINIENLSKSFGFKKVLDNINLQFNKGDFVTIFGPNGAGKTTLIRILSTIIKSDTGTITISDYHIRKQVTDIRKIIGLLSHESFLYQNLTVSENLKFFGKLYNLENLDESILFKLNKLGVYSKRNELIRNLSNGIKQRISIVRSIIHDPKIILLDEPFVGLDIEGSTFLLELLNDFKNESKTAFVTTHDLKLGLHECSNVVVLNKGKIKMNERIENIDILNFEETYKKLLV